uniref:WAT1-related protein n=2 Tax=Cajanus cajan TaxID=3821 RepID=A0A151R1W8_CAJCA|nr:Auxin-induced protein 5NG4 [Cajanus cajan]
MSGTHREMEKIRRTLKQWLSSSKVLWSMILVQVFISGMQLLSKAILVKGSFIFAIVSYRHIVAAICILPFAIYFERGRKMDFSLKVWFWLFVNALMGMTLAQGFYYYGLRDTSATYSANFLNLIPVFTFFTSIISRMEKLSLHTWTGRTKLGGAILCVMGALTSSIYKGKEFYIGHHHSHHVHEAAGAHETHKLRGTIFLLCGCLSYTTWFLAQVRLMKVFPLRYWGTMLSCILAAIQAAIIGVCIDSSKASWKLEWNLQLVTIVYSGALTTAAAFCIISWAITIKGPSYPPMFNPLALIFVAFSEAILLGEPLSVGTMLGVVFIIVGLYSFLWGKSKETMLITQQPNVADTEESDIIDLIPAGQSPAAVVPSFSHTNSKTRVFDIEKSVETESVLV